MAASARTAMAPPHMRHLKSQAWGNSGRQWRLWITRQ